VSALIIILVFIVVTDPDVVDGNSCYHRNSHVVFINYYCTQTNKQSERPNCANKSARVDREDDNNDIEEGATDLPSRVLCMVH